VHAGPIFRTRIDSDISSRKHGVGFGTQQGSASMGPIEPTVPERFIGERPHL
jgi:hypothetical protein